MNIFCNQKKVKVERLTEQILNDAKDTHSITILCLGKYSEELPSFLSFATKVGTILKTNNFQVYGCMNQEILIDKNSISDVILDIKINHPNTFLLVVMNGLTDSAKMVGNLYYENTPFINNNLHVGDATLKLCGSFGNNNESLKENSLSKEEVDKVATDTAIMLMNILEEFNKNLEEDLKLSRNI